MPRFDKIISLDLDDVAVDGSLHKTPYGGEDTGLEAQSIVEGSK